jgi:hypothetical protein
MKTMRVGKIDAFSETQTPCRGRRKGLWWGLVFMLVACLLAATDNGWALGNSSLNGTYVFYDLQSAFGGQDSHGGWGTTDSSSITRREITFNGAGSWSGTETDYELQRQISEVQEAIGQDQMLSNAFTVLLPDPSSESISGTYSVGSDGSGSVNTGEGTEPIFVSADGSTILMGKRHYNTTPYAWVNLAMGAKKTSVVKAMPWLHLLLGD